MTQLFGQEFLGAAHNYEKFAIKNLPAGRCGKTFSKEFGPAQNIYKKWAEKKVHPVIASQGLWRGGAHDYSGQKTLTEGLKELEKFAKIASDYKDQTFQFSIFCEHKEKTSYLEKVFKAQWEIVKFLPNVILVNTPMSGGDLLLPGAFGIPQDRLANEVHGNWKPNVKGFAPTMWACDGLPAQDCNIQQFKNTWIKAFIIWLWMQQFNCKTKVDETTPIAQRKVKPIEKQVLSLEALIPNKGIVKLDKDSLYKSHADQHGSVATGREQKPVIISKVNADVINFVAANGKVVKSAARQGNYTDGRPLYRSTEWGFETVMRAIKTAGSAIVKLIAVKGKRKTDLGTVQPAFRENAWRNKAQLRKMLKADPKAETFFDDEKEINPDWV